MIWLAGIAALVISYLSQFLVRPILSRYGIVDVPNGRSSHQTATLRGAGLGVLFTVFILGLVLLGASVAVFLKAKPLEHLEG